MSANVEYAACKPSFHARSASMATGLRSEGQAHAVGTVVFQYRAGEPYGAVSECGHFVIARCYRRDGTAYPVAMRLSR